LNEHYFWGDENGSLLRNSVGPVHGTEKENLPSCFGGVHCLVLMMASDIRFHDTKKADNVSAFFLRTSKDNNALRLLRRRRVRRFFGIG
jgi:hypothetical protein